MWSGVVNASRNPNLYPCQSYIRSEAQMAGIFDRLQKQIDDKRKEGGISVLDLADLPPALRKIMRLMLRQTKMSYTQLREAIEQLPEGERLTHANLKQALNKLSEQAWLIQIGEGERAVYKVNLRRRAGSNLSETIWQNLDSKLKR
jgi:predicted transcriptional regulator